ncbi:MAG TPA: response regulator [Spirochaetota bacterium]|nr:response regulator [Spirochaetota bacterium]HPC41147.1 response regulator [Spirochaetota bacterium]HPL15569.1 response regulator [Spirochaetota bacterium]HRS78222.1 response regulator [Spirochaetota bacterium]HRT76210.1 response regulator [Spirochaetota bacterium]
MKRILVVDDNDDNLYLLRSLLEGRGYEVDEASNGAEALSRVRADAPDMIISDILMPEMDGFTFCRTIKKDGALKDIPFIFYTATYTDSRDEDLAIDMGADAFIVKPVEPDVFLERLTAVLAAREGGALPAAPRPPAEEGIVLREYNEALIRKLEHKMLELEQANRDLEAEIGVRKKTEDALRDSEERYRSLFENSMDGVLLTEPNGSILKANPSACLIFGRNEEDIRRAGRSGLIDASDPRLGPALEERERTGRFFGELTGLRGDGSKFPCEISSVVFRDHKGKSMTSMILRDITERKKAEEKLLRASEDKDALLKEIHHRVKNNMQIINSMINLHLNESIASLTHDEIIAISRELQNRIRSMALVHELLYSSKSLSRVNFNEYMKSLVESLSRAYHVFCSGTSIILRVTERPVHISMAVPIGQIANELLTNALKYAFPAGREGEITITMTVDDNMFYHLTVCDNGIGLPRNFDVNTVKSFGLRLVSLLVKQLGGSMECRNDNGAVFDIWFSGGNGKSGSPSLE